MTDYHKLPSTGIEKRIKVLAITLTETEQRAAQELAGENKLSCSAYFGCLVLQHLEASGKLPEGYAEAIKKEANKKNI